MKAPDKIYVHVKGDKVTNTWNSTWIGVHDVEYIRTDAFIEKACEFLNDRIKHDSIDYPMATVHLIDDFKNYMKEV